MDKWRPIESAPHGDGLMLILWEPHSMGGFAFVGTCERSRKEWFNNLDFKTQFPTHWMPLPAPPETVRTED